MTKRHPSDLRQRLERARLCFIMGLGPDPSRDPVDVARAAVRGGVDVVQIRLKGSTSARVAELAVRVREACCPLFPLVIVNDDPQAAAVAAADGVHLGQTDSPIGVARALLGASPLIGLSTHTLAQARVARRAGADYIGFGAMFATRTKDRAEVIGPDQLPALAAAADLPWFAIGGIDADNLAVLTALGCRRVAVGSAIQDAADPEAAARALLRALPA